LSTKRVTLSQARNQRRQLYFRQRTTGNLVPVLCWRKWGADIHMQVITGCYVVSKKTILEVER
jgi:hypothetical protein